MLIAFQSHLRCAESMKVARPVESTPNARYPSQLQAKLHQETRLDELKHTSRYFLRKRANLQQNNVTYTSFKTFPLGSMSKIFILNSKSQRMNPLQSKKSWFDQSAKLTRYYDRKENNYHRENIKLNSTSSPAASCQNFYRNENFGMPSVYQRKNSVAR